ncbi:MAG: recombinase family protein [Monoglobales bacterium]
MAGTKRAFAYARFSSEMQRNESIDAQLRAIQEYAEKNGYIICRSYVDKAKSATTDQRPQFQQMMSDMVNNEVDAIIVHKLDRFARNRYDSAIYRNIMKKNNVVLLSVIENLNDSPEAIILESVIEGFNEYYSKNLAREVEKGKKENALKCKHVGGIPPLGYDVDPVTKKLVINPTEAEAVKTIYTMYLDGCGYSEIIRRLNQQGFKTKRGNKFRKNSIYEILKNEKYTGVYIYNKSAARNPYGAYNRHKYKSDDEIIRVPEGTPQIISEKDFEKVQIKIKQRKYKTATYKAKHEYLLTGKIQCGVCGSIYVGNARKANSTHPEYVSYRCSRKNGSLKCTNKEIRKDIIEDIVLSRLADYFFDESILADFSDTYNEYITKQDVSLNDRIGGVEAEISSLSRQIDNIVNVIAQTGSNALIDKLKFLETERDEKMCTLSSLQEKLHSERIDDESLKKAFRKAKVMLKNGNLETQKLIVNTYVNCVKLYPDRIEIIFNLMPDYTVKDTLMKE